MATRPPPGGNKVERNMVRHLDDLSDYEYYKEHIAGKIRKMIKKGFTPERIRKEMLPLIQARQLSIAFSGSARSQVTLNAIKDIIDRVEGTPAQRIEVTKKYAVMDKEELKAMAIQRMRDVGILPKEEEVISVPTRQSDEK